MSYKIADDFHFVDWAEIDRQQEKKPTDEEKYKKLVEWAGQARGKNPGVFDALTEWVLDDSQWSEDKLAENEGILMQGVFARFKRQNSKLRAYLKGLEPSNVVNSAIWGALDRFDGELSGASRDERLRETVAEVFADFSAMKRRDIRELMAGQKTGSAGVNHVEIFGFVNYLKDCDAGVQWALFMPDVVKNQQQGFKVESFEYKKMPAMRFVGRECTPHDPADMSWKLDIMRALDLMPEHKSGFDCDVFFQHHYGKCVDVGPWHGFWGRFMKANAPVPEGFVYFDFVPKRNQNDFQAGPPFFSQFAYAVFSGDAEAMHKSEGFDSDAMYDVTRNIILGQGVCIPYPEKYWTAEVFPDGCGKPSSAYMFSAEP